MYVLAKDHEICMYVSHGGVGVGKASTRAPLDTTSLLQTLSGRRYGAGLFECTEDVALA